MEIRFFRGPGSVCLDSDLGDWTGKIAQPLDSGQASKDWMVCPIAVEDRRG